MENLEAELSKYGMVIECGGNDTTFTVHITTGFKNGAMDSFRLIELINNAVGDKYPMLKSCVIDTDKFYYVIKIAD